jgi:hypothetical protein
MYTVMLVPEPDQADYAEIKFIANFLGKYTLCVIGSKVDGENNEQKLSRHRSQVQHQVRWQQPLAGQ